MRFVRKEHIITTICNEEVSDNDAITTLIKNLKEDKIEFSLTLKRYFASIGDYKEMFYNKVRVKNVESLKVDFNIFDHGVYTILKDIDYSDIVKINAVTTIDRMIKVQPELTRADYLDIDLEE
jgi:hypothetical protein